MAVCAVSGALQGVDAVPIMVEVDLLRRLPSVAVVGLAAHAVKESTERVRSAIASAGFEFPRQRIVINLAPADLRKEGTALDLPIALAILAAQGVLPAPALQHVITAGELSLGGELRPVRGGLPLAILARNENKTLVLPGASAREAAAIPGVEVLRADHLAEVVDFLNGTRTLIQPSAPSAKVRTDGPDLCDVHGQHMARRALEISAAGAHHLLLRGPPGCGKSMLARRLPTILPSMSFDEALAAARIRSAAGLEPATALARTRPFRAPHHSVTVAGLVGDRTLRPGEVSLAHAGVLFLDEAAEFRRSVLEVLREPLEEQVVRITRAEGSICYPAALTLVLATNPCPCGRRGSPLPCTCTDRDVCRYQRRISGPILDRVDLHVDLSPVGEQELLHRGPGEPSSAVRARVEDARKRAETRGQPFPNGQLSTHDVERFAPLDPKTREILARGMRKHLLTARATHGIRKVARTIADLAGSDMVEPHHLTEALAYRPQAHGP